MIHDGPIPPGDLVGHGEWPLFTVHNDEELDKMIITIDRRHPEIDKLIELRVSPTTGIRGATFEP